jgi:hypothetical protein
MSTLSDKVQAVRKLHPTWSFEEAWRHVETVHPELVATAKATPHKKKETCAEYEHVETIARRLMQRNSKLTFGCALEITRNCLPAVQADLKKLLKPATDGKPKVEPAGRVEAGEGYPPHPGLAAARAKGLLLVEGGFSTPIFPK